MQARDNKTAEVDKLTNRAVDGFIWSPYLLHVILAACLKINQFSLYFWHQAAHTGHHSTFTQGKKNQTCMTAQTQSRHRAEQNTRKIRHVK
jgi:hypothetical protein